MYVHPHEYWYISFPEVRYRITRLFFTLNINQPGEIPPHIVLNQKQFTDWSLAWKILKSYQQFVYSWHQLTWRDPFTHCSCSLPKTVLCQSPDWGMFKSPTNSCLKNTKLLAIFLLSTSTNLERSLHTWLLFSINNSFLSQSPAWSMFTNNFCLKKNMLERQFFLTQHQLTWRAPIAFRVRVQLEAQ